MVVRDGCTVFRSPVQQHDFNFTYQLESGNNGDLPSSGQVCAHYSLSPLPANVSYEEPNCSLKLKIFIMLLLYIFKE